MDRRQSAPAITYRRDRPPRGIFEVAPAAAVYAVQRESLGRYIRERKLLLAARDLRESDARVYDIRLRYGFDSQQTFTRIFTRTFNQPPGVP